MSNLLNIKDQSGNWIPIPVVTNGIKSITQNEDYTLTITLNDGTTYTTTSIKGEDGQDYILTEQDKQDIAGLVDTPVDDVQIDGTSIVENGVANVPIADGNTAGAVKINPYYGIGIYNGQLMLNAAQISDIKIANTSTKAVSTVFQHASTFYGLAKASGDTTQSQSDNPIGTYTDEAKVSIKNMLGVEDVDIDSKAPVITETISGDIVSFDDGADDMPLESLVVDINPVQDLHGYDSPWVGGSGKNLVNYDAIYHSAYDTTSLELNPVSEQYRTIIIDNLDAGTYTFSTDLTDCFVLRYAENGVNHGVSTAYTVFTFTVSAKSRLLFCFRKSDSSVITEAFKVQIEKGSTATDWTPYENICPITGRTGADVTRCGKNLFDKTAYENIYTTYDYRDSSYFCKRIQLKPNTEYTVSFTSTGADSTCIILFNNIAHVNEWGFLDLRNASGSKTYTTDDTGCLYIGSVNVDNDKYNDRMSVCEIQIEEGSTATAYEPYTGRSITIDLGQTVYGGYVDVMTGKLTLTYYFCTPDNAKKIAYGIDAQSNLPYAYFTLVQNGSATALSSRTLCSMYKAGAASGIDKTLRMWTSEADIWDSDLDVTSLDTVKAYFADLVIVYPLATPIEIQLDAHTINSLYGQNNIFADTGNSEVTYRADSELYIDKQIPDVPVEDVQINGTSILTDGVANIPVGGNDLGVVKENLAYGIDITGQGQLLLITPSDIELKKGYAGTRRAIMTLNQHIAAFYGLAKAAGADEKDSTLPVGQYTDSAKTAIKNMLGVIDGGGTISETITGTDPTITAQNNFRYMCGELYTLNFTPCVSGVCEVIFTSGATPTVLTLPDTVRMPAWWTGVEANTTYEISIVDGVYGAVMSWS